MKRWYLLFLRNINGCLGKVLYPVTRTDFEGASLLLSYVRLILEVSVSYGYFVTGSKKEANAVTCMFLSLP